MGRIMSAFGFHSTAAEVVEGMDLAGKRVVVTGGASGIGVETCRAFAGAGAEVTLAVRDPDRAAAVVADLIASTGNRAVRTRRLDLADPPSVARFAEAWEGPLHILVNNAGIMALPDLQRNRRGWEMQFATNYLGHFALAAGLYEALAEVGNARIVSLSSSGHLFSPVMFDDPHFNFVPYDPLVAYGQSKTAAVLFGIAVSRRWTADGITANAVNPGAIATNLQRHTGGLRTPAERRKTPAQGAATTLLVATSPALEGISGRYFEDSNEAQVVHRRTPDYSGVAPYAIDEANAERLWAMSLDLLS